MDILEAVGLHPLGVTCTGTQLAAATSVARLLGPSLLRRHILVVLIVLIVLVTRVAFERSALARAACHWFARAACHRLARAAARWFSRAAARRLARAAAGSVRDRRFASSFVFRRSENARASVKFMQDATMRAATTRVVHGVHVYDRLSFCGAAANERRRAPASKNFKIKLQVLTFSHLRERHLHENQVDKARCRERPGDVEIDGNSSFISRNQRALEFKIRCRRRWARSR